MNIQLVRVANADKTEHLEGRGEIIIQGQQIGISESTYYKLKKAVDPSYKKKSLNLDKNGKKVYVVHQQDRATKAQPVDWYYNKKTPTYISDSLVNIVIMLIMRQHTIRK